MINIEKIHFKNNIQIFTFTIGMDIIIREHNYHFVDSCNLSHFFTVLQMMILNWPWSFKDQDQVSVFNWTRHLCNGWSSEKKTIFQFQPFLQKPWALKIEYKLDNAKVMLKLHGHEISSQTRLILLHVVLDLRHENKECKISYGSGSINFE